MQSTVTSATKQTLESWFTNRTVRGSVVLFLHCALLAISFATIGQWYAPWIVLQSQVTLLAFFVERTHRSIQQSWIIALGTILCASITLGLTAIQYELGPERYILNDVPFLFSLLSWTVISLILFAVLVYLLLVGRTLTFFCDRVAGAIGHILLRAAKKETDTFSVRSILIGMIMVSFFIVTPSILASSFEDLRLRSIGLWLLFGTIYSVSWVTDRAIAYWSLPVVFVVALVAWLVSLLWLRGAWGIPLEEIPGELNAYFTYEQYSQPDAWVTVATQVPAATVLVVLLHRGASMALGLESLLPKNGKTLPAD